MAYQLTLSGDVRRIADGALIPNDPTLGLWQEYQDWLGQGNTPLPAATFDPVAAMGRLRAQRDAVLLVADRIQLSLLSKDDAAGASLVEDCKQALRDLPQDADLAALLVAPGTTDKAWDHAALLKYRTMVAPLPTAVQALFVKVATA